MESSNESQKLTPAVRLGRRLRRLREARGLSIRQLCEQPGVGPLSHSYIGRVELGQQLPSEDLVKRLDSFFDTDGVLHDLWELSHDALPGYIRKVVVKEADAVRIQVFNNCVVPALLQTPEYTRAAFEIALHNEPQGKIDELVAIRASRQGILDQPESPYYWAIMDEVALRRPNGNREVMVKQLRHLLASARRPHIVVQVLPFSAGNHGLLEASLTLHLLRSGAMIAGIEMVGFGESVESPRRIAELAQEFDLVSSLALPEQQSLDLIQEYLEGYENGCAS